MANQVQYRIGFSADTSAVKSSLRELETSLKKISTIHLDSFMDDASLESAAKAAQDLQAHLHKAVNVDTGKLNLSAFNASLQKSNQSVTSLANDLLNAGNAGSQAFMQLARSIAAAEVPIKKVNSTLASIGQTLKNTVKWELSSSFVHGIEGAFSNALGYVKNLNTSLTNIRIVTGASVEEMARFAEQANIAAKALSTTTKAYADASLIYYQQGDSAEQAAKKAAITIKAANASFNTSAAEMSEYLTAVWNSYQVGANELERYVDIMAALGAKTATSLEEIATSMQKVAATANTVGVSMEQVSSIISTVSSVTRESAESIGTSYKTIFARIGDLKLGGKTEDGLGLGQVSSALESIGIEILDSSNNLRDMGDIITDLGTKWQVMNEAQKTAIAQVVAGKRQYTQLMALFENWDMYNKNLNIAEGAEGELQKMQDIYAESWEAASARVTASMEDIYSSLLNDQSMIKMLGIVEVLVEAFGGLIKGMGGLPGIIMSVGGALGNAFAPEIASQITNIGVKIKDIFTNNNSEQQKFLETNRQMRAELTALAKDSAVLGPGQQTEINGLINVSEAKDKLIQSSKNLSQAQVAEIESAISGYQQEIERIAQLQQSMDKLEADRTKAAADLQKIILQDDVKAVQRKDDENTIAYRQRAFREANEGMLRDAKPLSLEVEFDETGLQAFAQSCGKTVDEIKKDFDTVGNALNTIFGKNAPENVSALLSKSEEFVTSMTNATNLGTYLQQVFVETGSVLDNSSASTDDIANDLQNAIDKAETLANALGATFSAEFLQLKSMPINLNTEEGKKQARELAAVLQEELDRMVQMAGPKAAALRAILVKITPPEHKAEVEALWASWAKGSITLQELEERAKKLGINFDKAIKQMTSSAESLPQKLTKLGSGISSLASMFNSLSHAWDTLKNPDVSGWQKFMAVLGGVSSILMGLKSVMDAGKVIQGAYNVLLAIGVGLEVADAAAKRDGAQAQREKNVEVLKGIGIETLQNSKQTLSGTAKAAKAAKGLGTVLKSTGGALLGAAKTALVAAGPYLAVAAAIAAVGVSIWAVVTAEERYKKALDERAEALTKARQENQEEISKLTNDTASLDAIMRDTTLTYEEQIEQINKIAAAYGVQATAVDALTNSYSKFANQMIAVNQTQAKENAQTASTNADTARSIVNDYLDTETAVFDDMYNLDTNYGLLMHSGISPTGYYTWEEYNTWAQNDARREWEENKDWYTDRYGTYDEFYANEYSTSAAQYYGDSQLFGGAGSTREAQVIWEQNGYGSGLLFDDFNSKKLSKREELFTDGEQALWASEEFGDKLNSYGFYFDQDDLALRNMYGVEQDWAGLMEFLQKQGYGEDSYTGSVVQILEDAHIGELISAEQEAANAAAIDALWHNDSFLSNIYNPNATTVSLKDTQALIESIGGNVETNAAVADVLSQYGAYGDTATVLGSVYKLADQSVNMIDLDVGVDAEEVKRDVVEQLMLAFPELDVETVLKLTPKDIIVNEDGTVSISDAVRDYVNASVAVNKQQGIQGTIDENYSLLTKDVLSEADYKEIMALADAGKLGDDFDVDAFVHQDAATRRAEIERRRAEANEQELAALDAQIVAAEQREEEYRGQFESWESNFNSVHGEGAYKSIQSKIAADTAARDELQAKITEAENGAQIDWTALGYDDIEAAREQVDAYNESIATNNALIEDGIVLETAWSGAASDRQQAQTDLNSSEYQQWTDNVQRATEAAEAFSDALNNQGQVSKETLALLSQYDSNALNNYQNMSNSEWTTYAYESAMTYYAELEKLYADDALALIAITQEKQALQEEYYNTLKTQAEETLKYIQEKAKEETNAIQNAMSLLNNIDFSEGLSALGVDGLEELRQALMEVYEDADVVDAMIRNIGKEKAGSKEAAIALADAKTALALKGHEALLNEQTAARSLIGYSATIEEIEPPLYEDNGLIKMQTEDGEILTQINGMPDNIFINDEGKLVQLDPSTGTYTILGDATSSVFLTSDGKLKTVNPATGTYHIIDDAKNAQFFNENGTLKVRTAYGTYIVQDINSTDFFTDQGVLAGKTANGTYTITSQNASVFFDSTTGKLKSDLNGSGRYTVSAVSGNTNVLVTEGSSLKLVSITDGNATFEANLTGSSGTEAGTLSVVNGVVTLNSVTAAGNIQASLLPGSYGGITAGEDGSISFTDIDPNSPQAQTFIQIAGQAGLGIVPNADGTGFTIKPPTTPTVDPVVVSAEAGDGISGTGTEGDPFVVDIDVADKHQRILVSYVEENYNAINDRLFGWQNLSQDTPTAYLGGTGFTRGEKGHTEETRDSLRSLGGGGLEDALDLAYMSYNGDFLRMYREDVTGRSMAREGTQALSTEVTAWYKQTQDYWMQVFKDYDNQMELVEAKMAEEIAALGENSGISLLFDMMQAEMSLGSSGNIMNLFKDYYDKDGNLVQSAQDSALQYVDLWMDSFEGSLQDGTMEDSAVFLIQGLVKGLQGNTEMLTKVAEMLGFTTIEAMNKALGIASPSRYTMEMGYWLIQGLSKGFQNTEFDPGDFGTSVMNRIKESLKDVDIAEIWASTGFGYNDLTADEFKSMAQAGTLNQGQKEQILKNWNKTHEDNTYASYDELYAAQGVDNILGSTGILGGVRGTTVKSREQVLQEKYGLGTELRFMQNSDTGKWGVEVFDKAQNDWVQITDQMYDTVEAAQDAFVASEYAREKTAEYLDGGFFADETLTDAQKIIMDEIITKAVQEASDGQFSDVSDYLAQEGNSIETLMPYLNDTYADYQVDLNNAVDLSWSKIKATWISTLEECAEIDAEMAEQTYERWVTTWEAIGKARIAALQGEDGSLADQWSEDEQLEMARRMQKSGMGLEEIVSTQLSGSYDLDASYLKLGSYASSGRGQMSDLIGLNMGPFGMPTNTTLDEYKRNTEAYWTAWANDSLSTSEFFSHTGDYEKAANLMYADDGTLKSQEAFLTEWATSLGKTVEQLTDAEREAALSYRETAATLVGGGALVKGDNGYKLNGDKDNIVEIYVDEKIDLSDEQWEENYNEAIAAGAASRIKYQTDYKAQMVDETEAEITRLESDQAIIQKAMEQGLESLSPEEFADYERIMEEGGYTTLSEANLGLASEMDATASSLARMRFAIENGYTVADDGTWVKPTEIKSTKSEATYTQEEAMAKTHGWQVSADDPSQYTMVQAFEGEDGKYYIVTSTASVDSLGTTDSNTFITGTSGAKTSSEYSDTAQDYNFEYYAEQAEMTADEFKTYAEVLNTTTDGQQMFNTKTAEGREALYNYASAVAKSEKGFEELQAITKDTWKELNDESKKGSRNWTKNIAGLRSTMSKLFNTDMKHITAKFVEDHLDELEKMATGTEEEAAAAQEAIQDDLVAAVLQADGLEATPVINVETGEAENALTYFQTALDQWDGKEVGFTIHAETEGAEANVIASLQGMLDAGIMTADQIASALNAIGWEPQITWQDVTMVNEDQETGMVTVKDSEGNTYTVKSTNVMRTENGLKIPVIGSARKISIPGGGSRKPSGGGGGGGGGDPKKIDKKKPEDEKERYHETEQTLERLTDELEKVDKLKSRAYGRGHLDAIKQEISLLKQEVGVQADYLKQAQEYLALDRNRVASLGATFNADGTISNYDELMDSIIAKYNAFVDKYNSSSAKQQENMEEEKEQMDEWYEESMEWISQYEETLNLTRDKENEILELQNEISAKTLEGIQYKVEFEVELNEEETDFLDYLNEKYGEVLEKQGILVENLVRQQKLAQENLASLNNAKTELDAKYANGELTQADYVEGLKDINSQILDNLSTLEELRKEIQEAYGNALDLATEKIDNHTEKMENASSAMQSYISIMGLLGQGIDYEKINEFYEQQYEYNLASLETQQQYLDALKEEEAYYLAKMASGELTETEREQFEALQDTIASVQDGILSKTEETLSALKEAFSSMVSGILRDFEESIAGAGNSLEDLAADYEYYLEVQERNVSTSKELYEVSKLNRQIEQDIADTSSSIYKQRLAALQEEIKAKSADRALTEYDIQMMNLEYELLQRQMALEEAKSAKDTVRLTRDSSGNYVYQYTANQDAVNEAQQGVEDVLQRMAEANAERVGQLEQETINAYQDMVAQIEEIANSEVLTQEEKNAKIAEIVARTQEKMGWIQKQYTIATENTALTYERIQDQYGKKMADAAQMTKDSMNGTIGEIINKTNEFSLNMQSVQGAVAEQLKLLQGNMDAVLTTTKWNEAAESIKDYDAVIEDAQKDAHNMIMTLGGENGLLTNIRTTTAAWDLQSKAVENLITYYEQLYKSILKIQQVESTKTPAVPDIPTPSTPPANDDPETDIPVDDAPEEEPTRSYPYGKASETSGKIKSGAKGDQVRAIQYALNELGYGNSGTNGLDGIFGTGTKKAVKEFQEANGITADGVVNNKTREKFKMLQFLTGGLVDYTGPAWVDGTKDHPELMLNASDTENMLAAVQTVRSLDTATLMLLDDFIKLATSSMLSVNSLHATGVHNTDQELQQQVHITAEFPNVQDSNEIQDAFDNLINRAAQFVGSIKK